MFKTVYRIFISDFLGFKLLRDFAAKYSKFNNPSILNKPSITSFLKKVHFFDIGSTTTNIPGGKCLQKQFHSLKLIKN